MIRELTPLSSGKKSAYKPILKHIGRRIELTNAEATYFCSILRQRKIRRRQFLLQRGDVCRAESYVVRGCLRTFYPDQNGFEHILQFAIDDWWIADLESFLLQRPSRLAIEALEDSEVVQIDREDIEELYKRVPKFERFFRLLFQSAFIAHQQRIVSVIGQDARQRYLSFSSKYPEFIRRIPQKHIAAYLGITPEFLSKIRRGLTRGANRS